jgi:hypothetical protein
MPFSYEFDFIGTGNTLKKRKTRGCDAASQSLT